MQSTNGLFQSRHASFDSAERQKKEGKLPSSFKKTVAFRFDGSLMLWMTFHQ
jgi:hypothetical protein